MSTANAHRIDPFQFRIFATFEKAEDRRREEYRPGRFFHFTYVGGRFTVTVVDDDQWATPPRAGQQLWLVGVIYTNNYGELELQVRKFMVPNEANPAPDFLAQMEGGEFTGITMIERTTYLKGTGEPGYKFLLRGQGLLYSLMVDQDEYETFPGNKIIVLQGRLKFQETYSSKLQSKRSYATLVLTSYRSFSEPRTSENEASSPDNSKAPTPRRQASEGK